MNFSEYFHNYVKTYHLSIPKLAQAAGINRSVLYRYITGERVPQKLAIVQSLADAMCMNSEERSEFLEAYDRAYFGDDVVNSYLYMHALIKTLNNADYLNNPHIGLDEEYFSQAFSESDEFVPLKSSHSIVTYAMRLLENCKDNRIMLLMQPTYAEIQNLLLPILGDKDVAVEQIVCFEKTLEKCYINLDILKYVLPHSFNLKSYNVYYHYDNIDSHINKQTLFPNLILTDNGLLLFDYDMQEGFFSANFKFVRSLTERFEYFKKTCFTLLEKGNYAANIEQMNRELMIKEIGTIFNQPCLAQCFDQKILNEAIFDYPEKESFVKEIFYRYGDWNGLEMLDDNAIVDCIITCCTKNGIRKFAEKGRIDEFPEEYYRPLTISERIVILERVLILCEEEKCKYYVLRKDLLMPENVQIYYAPTEKFVFFRHISKDNLRQINIKETSILNTVNNSMKYLEEKNLVLSQEEFKAFIKETIENLKKLL